MNSERGRPAEPEGPREAVGPRGSVSRRTFLGGVAAGAVGVGAASYGGLFFGETAARAGGNPFVGEIRMFGGNFAPSGWALCNGQLLPISQNTALFSLIGTFYGGDGAQTFGLPDLRGRMPLHQSSQYALGQSSGLETISLVATQMPLHTHVPLGSSHSGTTGTPTGTSWARTTKGNAYSTLAPTAPMSTNALATAGSGQPHDNMSPFLAVTFIISLFGIYPSRN